MNKVFYWLNFTEYILIIISLISLIISRNSSNLNLTLLLVIITLALNLINRLQGEKRQRLRLSSYLKKINQRLEKIELIISKNQVIPSIPTPITASLSNSSQDYLIGMEKSLNNLIEYLNNSTFGARIKNLENTISDLSNKINNNLIIQNSKVSKNLPQPKNNTMLTTPFRQKWHCVKTLSAHPESVTSLAVTADGKFLASASSDKTVKIWSLETYKLIDSIVAHEQGLLCLDFAKTKQEKICLATGSYDQTIKLWTLEADEKKTIFLKISQTLTNHTGSIYSLVFNSQANILVSGSYDKTIKQWDLSTGQLLCSSFDALGAVYSIALQEKNSIIASAGADGSISLWKLQGGEMLGFLSGNVSSVQSLAISADAQILAAGCVDGKIRLWRLSKDMAASKVDSFPFQVIQAHVGDVTGLIFTPNTSNLFSSGADGKVQIWDVASWQNVGILNINEDNQYHHNRILAIAVNQEKNLLIAGSVNGKITFWSKQN